MNLFEMLSTKKFNLTGNIDERYFQKQDDGTYKATPLFMHNVARDVANDIKAMIINSDDPNYVTHSNNKGEGFDVKDTWAEHEHNAAFSTKWKVQLEKEAEMWKEYQKSHKDEFDQNAPTIATGDIPTTRFFSAYHPDFTGKSNAELMAMYKEATELSKRYGDELRDTLPQRPGNLMSKPEFKDAHQALRRANKVKLGIPMDEEDKWTCPMVHKDDRASLIRSNSKVFKAITNADGSEFEDYVNGLVTHLTGSTPEQYQKEWEELYTDIDDACNNLTRGGRGTKLAIQRSNAKNAMNIAIFTADKGDGNDRIKLAGINKVEPNDPFYTFTLYLTAGCKRPVRPIATKNDLRVALTDLITVLEDNDKKEYIDCVQNAIDNIL